MTSSMQPMTGSQPVFALALHGKVGSWRKSATKLENMEEHGAPTFLADALGELMGVASLAHDQFRQHLIEPNQRQGVTVRCFLHSWNPEAGKQLNMLYQPHASRHEPTMPHKGPAMSQHLSMLHVMRLVNASRPLPQMVFVSRFDLLLYTDVKLQALLNADLLLPNHCILARFSQNVSDTISQACGCGRKKCHRRHRASRPPTVSHYVNNAKHLSVGVDYSGFLLDYFFIATPDIALSFTDIYTKANEYRRFVRKIHGGKWMPQWSHFYWAVHVNYFLPPSTRVRFGPLMHARDFTLARFFQSGVDCEIPMKLKGHVVRLQPELDAVDRMTEQALERPFLVGNVSRMSRVAEQCPQRRYRGESLMCPPSSPACTMQSLNRDRG